MRKAKKRLHLEDLRPPRIVRFLALVDELQGHLQAGSVDQSGLSHLYGMSRARVTQLMKLRNLHPAIIEYIRRHSTTPMVRQVTERALRLLTALPLDEQFTLAVAQVPGFGEYTAAQGPKGQVRVER